jgi:excisionase family DNA binding protein
MTSEPRSSRSSVVPAETPRARSGIVPPDRLLDAEELARILHVPPRWVRDQAREGGLPCIRLGHYVRFRWETVEAWLADLEAAGGAPARKHRPRVRGGGTK